jgi:hypothetical protein
MAVLADGFSFRDCTSALIELTKKSSNSVFMTLR